MAEAPAAPSRTASQVPDDPRQCFTRADLAAESLRGKIEAPAFAAETAMVVSAPLLDFRSRPDAGAMLDSQLVFGERVRCCEIAGDWAWVQLQSDGRVGYVARRGLAPADGLPAPTHRVLPPGSHLYREAAVKAPAASPLPAPAMVAVVDHVPARGSSGTFARLAAGLGYVPSARLAPLEVPASDWVAEAERYLGAPYLWGGRSSYGIDCSALIQLALAAAGIPALRDTDQQEAMGWKSVAIDTLARGDIVFWRGHVGVMVDGARLLHANAGHMATATEPLQDAINRIAASEGHQITTTCRPVCAKLKA
ncbi:MAG: NlpC/P60 family protein [Pseudomonadota bacterium]